MVLEQLCNHLETQISALLLISKLIQDSSDGPVVKNLPASLGDTDLIPGLVRFHMPQGTGIGG